MPTGIDAGDTAWLLASTALVLLMTPGLALFYGGMVRAKSTLNMIMMSLVSVALVTVSWLAAGYSLAFGHDLGGLGLLGGFEHIGLKGITPATPHGHVPALLFVTFQLTFAILTTALISGAIADRAKFSAWMVFVPVWALVVYAPIAHWVWGGGWISDLGALDYAGGLVVEIASGASGLAMALVLGPRIGFRKEAMRPHNLPMVLLGVGLLWFGWFGFNAGSALAANGTAAAVFLNTLVAGCTGLLGWLLVEQRRDGHPTTFGAASGVVAGLVAITPSCGSVNVLGALAVGLVAGVVCSYAVGWKHRLGYDDSLDVVGVHLVGGIIGTLLIGLLAVRSMTGGAAGLITGGGGVQLGRQAIAVPVVGLFAFTVTFAVGKLIDKTLGFRVSAEDETSGVDLALHAETAYEHGVSVPFSAGHAGPLAKLAHPSPLGHAQQQEQGA
ncbi:ammonium transporter [Actinomadura montaniterrae]|uniref:Ammonium transporter n=1 Tax=Actinomadura montaniterrae TaxID=1803903 RepID=A0A6L3VXU7_9ACTN|nr:ammonium transporter [Actinomadura montaniterrae]KAB2376453.1 ammonium transporter [Actinomadura montaniterrae]